MSKVLDAYLKPAPYKESDFAHLSVKQLRKIGSCFAGYPDQDPSVEAVRLKYIEGRTKVNIDAFKLFIIALRNKKMRGQVIETARIEETAHAKGSQVICAPKTITVAMKNGDEQVITNSTVPDPSAPARPYSGTLIACLCRSLECNGGELEVTLDSNHQFVTAFGTPQSSVSVTGLATFGMAARDYIVAEPFWKTLAIHDRMQLTGSKLIAFFSRFANLCAWETYFSLHTLIVVKVLRVFSDYSLTKSRAPKFGRRLKFQRDFIIADDCYSLCLGPDPDPAWGLKGDQIEGAKSTIRNVGCMAFYYRGARMYQASVSTENPKLLDVRKAVQDGDSCRGGNKSAFSILASARGYSGVPTNATREYHLFFSLACFCVFEHKKVDIHLPSVGYLDTMISTLKERAVLLCGKPTTDFDFQKNVRFILTYDRMPTDERRAWCSTNTRSDAFQVLQSARSAPTITEHIKEESIESMADNYFESVKTFEKFAIITPVFGDYCWNKERGWHVFRYGKTANFQGIVSTYPGLKLLGVAPSLDKLELVPLVPCPTRQAYYAAIILENRFKNAYFLAASSNYSPISNVVCVRTKGIVLTEEEALKEDRGGIEHTEGWDNERVEDYRSDDEDYTSAEDEGEEDREEDEEVRGKGSSESESAEEGEEGEEEEEEEEEEVQEEDEELPRKRHKPRPRPSPRRRASRPSPALPPSSAPSITTLLPSRPRPPRVVTPQGTTVPLDVAARSSSASTPPSKAKSSEKPSTGAPQPFDDGNYS